MPASSARFSSPPETTSAPAPSRASVVEHRLVGVRLHGVADERPDIGEGAGEHLVMARQRRGRIAIERGPHRGRETVERDAFGMQNAAAIVEVIHTCRNRCLRPSMHAYSIAPRNSHVRRNTGDHRRIAVAQAGVVRAAGDAGGSRRLEIHRDAVDAIAQMGRRRAVVEDVAEMAAAAAQCTSVRTMP